MHIKDARHWICLNTCKFLFICLMAESVEPLLAEFLCGLKLKQDKYFGFTENFYCWYYFSHNTKEMQDGRIFTEAPTS